jgi:excisionase family DNA binding protein
LGGVEQYTLPVPDTEILTLKEVADLLRVAEKTVYTMAQTKDLPAFKVRGQWRFRREDINRWIDEQTERKKSSAGDSDE